MPSIQLAALAIALIGASIVHANPLPSKVRRDDPAPSSYPIGTECPGEWKYLNFDPNDDTDKGRLEKIHETVCGYDVAIMVISAIDSIEKRDKSYQRYFSNEDGDNELILSVFRRLYPEGSGTNLGELVSTFVVDNKDWDNSCAEADDFLPEAYTRYDEEAGYEKTHFCDVAYDLPDIYGMQCGSFDVFPSEKMDSLSRIALHEMMHYDAVGQDSEVDDDIVDAKNEDNVGAYGPARCHGLIDPEQDDQPGKADINADSYAWLAVDSYWSFACSTTPGEPDGYFQDPPHY